MSSVDLSKKFRRYIKNRQEKKIVLEVAEEFKQISGREYGLFEEYHLSDAERA